MQRPPRHGCLTAFLIFLILVNVISVVMYLAAGDTIRQALPDAPSWISPALALLGVLNIVFAIALFQWKKWGFYGFIITSVIAVIINISIGMSVLQGILGLVGVAILFGVLQIGGDDQKAWNHLE